MHSILSGYHCCYMEIPSKERDKVTLTAVKPGIPRPLTGPPHTKKNTHFNHCISVGLIMPHSELCLILNNGINGSFVSGLSLPTFYIDLGRKA